MDHHLESPVRKDHEAIDAQVGALDAVFKVGVAPNDRWIALKWILRSLTPAMNAHLQREEEIQFPALEQLSGVHATAILLLDDQHRRIRSSLKQLDELIYQRPVPWEQIAEASQRFVEMLKDHEKSEERLLLDVLETGLKRSELLQLTETFHQAAQKGIFGNDYDHETSGLS